jgi:hypothetical protein
VVNPAAIDGGVLEDPSTRPMPVLPGSTPKATTFDADKERRYQEWVKKQLGQ